MKVLALVALFVAIPPAPPREPRELRVCADPDNLPFSNTRGEGFENELAALLAGELGATLRTTWWPQRQGFFRNTLGARTCDVVIGVPVELEQVLATRPYLRSSYVFATRRGSDLAPRSLDDPALRTARIGVQLVGDDGANPPPVHALARRGIVDNVRGYPVLGGDAILAAVAAGEIDVALVWGPRAGPWARRLRLHPIPDTADARMSFAIGAGVRRGDRALRDELDAALARRKADIARILDAHGVPR